MDIHFVSSLAPEDEARLAEVLMTALTGVLDQLPIAYTLRIDAGGSCVLRHSHTPDEPLSLPPEEAAMSS
jgi:hypothetical protein